MKLVNKMMEMFFVKCIEKDEIWLETRFLTLFHNSEHKFEHVSCLTEEHLRLIMNEKELIVSQMCVVIQFKAKNKWKVVQNQKI